jgi:carbonic anhydrase
MDFDRNHVTRIWKAALRGLLLALLTFAGGAVAEEDVHWTYSGKLGPEHWGELSKAFAACSEGKNQSPIDIVDPIDADPGPIGLVYRGSTTAVVNNGHTLQVDVGPGNSLDVDGQMFELVQFHLHSPSEHWIHGEQVEKFVKLIGEDARGPQPLNGRRVVH